VRAKLLVTVLVLGACSVDEQSAPVAGRVRITLANPLELVLQHQLRYALVWALVHALRRGTDPVAAARLPGDRVDR